MDLEIADHGAVITGASRGIGRAIARRLASEGVRTLLVARSEQALAEVGRECGERAAILALDVTAEGAAAQVAAAAQDQIGQVDILINNAGVSADRPLETLAAEDYQAQWEIHVLAPLRLMQTFAPAMAERGWGRIVNVASIAGRRPTPTNVAYSVAKSAELMLTRAFADHYAARGVGVNAVNPGPVENEMWTSAGGMADQVAARRGITREEVLAEVGASTPRGQSATSDEIAAVVALLCSPLAANVIGAGWQNDGGLVPFI